MKKMFSRLTVSALLCIAPFTSPAFAQNVGIGTSNPDASAMLDIQSIDKGLLIPRMSISKRDLIVSPAKGLMVYVTDDSSLYIYHTTWHRLVPSDEVWSTKGNSGINPALQFIGTTDDNPLRFRVNNVMRMQIDSSGRLLLKNPGDNLFIGDGTGINTTGTENYFIGNLAGASNTSGQQNQFTGHGAGYSNTTGSWNSFNGYQAGYNNSSGFTNDFNGYIAGKMNTTGSRNQFTGWGAGHDNTTGSDNCFVGFSAGSSNKTGSYNTIIGNLASVANDNLVNAGAIGFNASVSQNNSFVIGGQGALAVNVGIGTTAPLTRLDVNSNALSSNIATFRSTGGYGQILVDQGTMVTDLGADLAGGYTGTNSAGDFKIRTGTVDRMFFQHSTGNVGIGIPNPLEKLDVAGKAKFSAGIMLPTSGGVPATLNYYEEYTQAGNLFNGSNIYVLNYTIRATRVGNQVTITFPLTIEDISISSAADMVMVGIPPRFRPVISDIRFPIQVIVNGIPGTGVAVVRTDGTISLKPNIANSSAFWSGVNNAGFYAFSVSYTL